MRKKSIGARIISRLAWQSAKRVGREAINATHNDRENGKNMTTTNDNNGDMIFIVTLPSAISYRQCVLGEGATKGEAMADAFGPKPWPKSARAADCYRVTRDELQAMRG